MEIQLDIDHLDAEESHADKIFVEREEGRTLLVFRRNFLDVVVALGPRELAYLMSELAPPKSVLDRK